MAGYYLQEDAKERLRDRKGVIAALDSGKPGQEIVGFSNEVMAEFYGAAYKIFENEEFGDAADAFLFLSTVDPENPDYWLGLGMARQMLQQWEEAIDAYEISAIYKLDSPIPYFYLSKCFFAVHEREEALYALELAIEYAGEYPNYAELKAEATAARDLLLKEDL